MNELIVEVGFLLNESFEYYDELLKKNGLENVFKCKTHDVYLTKNKNFDGLTENEIKKSCIRFRNPQKKDIEEINRHIQNGYVKVFDTTKKDYHYSNGMMKSRIQLQEIENIGLVVYYDNPDYYDLPLDEQRHKLIKELNSYGFDFKDEDLGLDKLRTLCYGKEMYSENQNG